MGIFLPNIRFEKATTKDLVILVLIDSGSLSIKEIHSKIVKEFSKPVSYQMVFKEVNFLEKENILKKIGKKFVLNKEWVSGIKSFFSKVEKALEEKDTDLVTKFLKNSSVNVSFDSIIELGRFFLYEFFNLPNEEKKVSVAHWHHFYNLIGLSKTELKLLQLAQ